MKALFTTNPGTGHLHALVPVIRALQAAGHEVALATSRTMCRYAEQLGIPAFPAGLDWHESEMAAAFPEIETMTPEERRYWFLTDLFADITPHKMGPDLLSICYSWQPDVLVRNDFEFSTPVIAERLGLPCATVSMEMFLPTGMWEMLIGDQLAYLRSVFGLPPYPAADMLYRHLYLCSAPPSYHFPEFSLPSHTHFFRYFGFDQAGAEGLPAWAAALPNRPTIYASLGTVHHDRTILETILAGLGGREVNLIVTVGRNHNPAAFGPQPDNVYIERYIPQTLLFPLCDLVIASGSYNTLTSALAHGLPLLVIPITDTQPLHAKRCAALGVGRVLKQPGQFDEELQTISQTLSPQTVADTVQEMLADPCYRQRAEQIRQQILSLPGPETTVPLLVQLAERGKK